MISAEVPILFSKAASIFIRELTLRAWIQTEEASRRTLQVGSLLCMCDELGCLASGQVAVIRYGRMFQSTAAAIEFL